MEPSRGKSICMPFESEEHYAACVADPERFRQHLTAVCGQHPALFPARMSEGFVLHDKSWSIKQQVMLRRLELKATAKVFLVRPSFLMPSMVGRTEAVEKALYLRHWGVPFDALAYVFGRDAMCWYRTEMALGRPAIVGSTVKQPEKLPQHVLADEKHTWALGHEVYVATTVGGGCILGATVTDAASADALEATYGEFAAEARALSPTYSPTTVCTDGWEGTQSAWRRLFPTVCIILCFLHSVLRACLKRSHSGCKTPDHQVDHGDSDPRLSGFRQGLEVFAQSPRAIEPAERAFHNPAPLQHLKSLSVPGAFHNYQALRKASPFRGRI